MNYNQSDIVELVYRLDERVAYINNSLNDVKEDINVILDKIEDIKGCVNNRYIDIQKNTIDLDTVFKKMDNLEKTVENVKRKQFILFGLILLIGLIIGIDNKSFFEIIKLLF